MTSSRKTTQYLMVNDMEYVVKCNNKYEFENFINSLEILAYNWCDGDKLKEFNPYEENKSPNGLCIYILINPNDKEIEFTFNGDHFNSHTTIYNPTVMILKLKNYKKSFEELSCLDFKCEDCPFNNKSCSFIDSDYSFGENLKRIEEAYEKAHNKWYEKGDKND